MLQIKQIKRILSVVLVLALLCAMPISVSAQDLRGQDLTDYPSLNMIGGFHSLYFNEHDEQLRTVAFNTKAVTGLVEEALPEVLDALKSLDLDRVASLITRVMWDWFGNAAMNGDGESIKDGITNDGPYLQPGYFEGGGELGFSCDWRLGPIENAKTLHAIIEAYEAANGGEPTKYNFHAVSASSAAMLAYIDIYGTERVASLVLNVSVHDGMSPMGEIAKKKFVLNPEALAYMDSVHGLGMSFDTSTIQPWLRGLFEPGILSVVERVLKLASTKLLNRVYDEVLIPLIFTMPGFWTFVPRADFEKARKALLDNKPEYAGLIKKINADYDILSRSDEIILKTAETAKVAVWAGYDIPLIPVGKHANVQSDGMLDTKYASLGATCAAPGMPFLPFYKQKVNCGHGHVSADRLVDASTCLLPEQTWFTKGKVHGQDVAEGWREWFFATPNPTVHDDPRYPQFMEQTKDRQFVPLVVKAGSPVLEVLKTIGLYLLKIWRWLLLLPLIWVDWVT